MAKRLDHIRPLTLEARVLERLREAILNDYFPPGSQLNQVQIAAEFGVSRGPLRYAIGKLEEEGLVHNIPHRGTFVTQLDRKSVRDLYDVRAVLEAYAVKLAVERCEPEDVNTIVEIIEEMRAAARLEKTQEVIRLDFLVHEFFMKLSDNSFLMQTWSTIKVQVRRALTFRHRTYPDLLGIADSHLPFIDLLKSKNADEAAKLMDAHIQDACEDLMERWVTNDTVDVLE